MLNWALSVTVRSAERAPVVVGVNVTSTMHLRPGASDVQLFVCPKSAMSAPVILTLVIVSSVVPELVMVTLVFLLLPCFTVPKFTCVGLKLAIGLITVAVKPACCGLPGALSVTLRVFERGPILLAEKKTSTGQVFPAVKFFGQEFCTRNSPPPFLPVKVMPVNVSGALPVFCTVISCETMAER